MTGAQLAADFKLLRSLVDGAGKAWKVVGPDVAFQAPVLGEILPTLVDFAAGVCDPAAAGVSGTVVDAFAWHWCVRGSERKGGREGGRQAGRQAGRQEGSQTSV